VYSGFAEFEAALDLLTGTPGLGDALGRAGRAHVEREYRWETVLSRYEELLGQTISAASPRVDPMRADRHATTAPGPRVPDRDGGPLVGSRGAQFRRPTAALRPVAVTGGVAETLTTSRRGSR